MGALIGVVVLMLANLVAGFFIPGGMGLRDGGPLAIIFSLVVIGVAAFSLLMDFDMADQAVRAGGCRNDTEQGRMLREERLVDIVPVARRHGDGCRLSDLPHEGVDPRSVGRLHRAQREIHHQAEAPE